MCCPTPARWTCPDVPLQRCSKVGSASPAASALQRASEALLVLDIALIVTSRGDHYTGEPSKVRVYGET